MSEYIRFYEGALFSLCEFCDKEEECKNKVDGKKVAQCSEFKKYEGMKHEDSSL